MGISGIFGKINIGKLNLFLEIPDEIYANTPTIFRIKLENKKSFFPTLLTKVEIFGKTGIFLFVDKKSEDSILIELNFNKRGIYKIEKIKICSVFPFNFFTRCKSIDKNLEIVVFPKPKPCNFITEEKGKKDKKGETSSKKTGFDEEIISIRDYKAGDPLKYINWKATAKTDKLKTKEMSSSSFKPVIIDFDSIETKDTEKKLSCITYLIIDFYKKKIPFGLKIKNNIFKPDLSKNHKIKLLKELARYGLET